MTTLQQIKLGCPVCETAFYSRTVVSTNSFGGKRTDFHERAVGTQPLPYEIHMCAGCGFAGSERSFSSDEEMFVLHEHSVRKIIDQVRDLTDLSNPPGSLKYEVAARIAEFNMENSHQVADLWLRAAWCAVNEEDTEAERFYRLHAAERFEEALEQFGTIPKDERAVISYLVGELWRRIGDDRKAKKWFNAVSDEITDKITQQWVLDAANQQRDCPRDWFN